MPISGQPYFSARSMTLHDLLGERLRQGAPEDREVLREDEDLAAEDRAVAGDHRVPPGAPLHHPEVRVAVAHVAVELDEAARVEQLLEALAREQLAAFALALDRLRVAGVGRLVPQLREPRELRLGRRLPCVLRRRHAERLMSAGRDCLRLRGRTPGPGASPILRAYGAVCAS